MIANPRGAGTRGILHAGELNEPTAQRYAQAIEASGRYWCVVFSGSCYGAVLEVRSRARPFPLIKRCLTVEEASAFSAATLPIDDPRLSQLTTDAPAIARWMIKEGWKSRSRSAAERRARQQGYTFGAAQFRQLWKEHTTHARA